jgi:hypothetical protein
MERGKMGGEVYKKMKRKIRQIQYLVELFLQSHAVLLYLSALWFLVFSRQIPPPPRERNGGGGGVESRGRERG